MGGIFLLKSPARRSYIVRTDEKLSKLPLNTSSRVTAATGVVQRRWPERSIVENLPCTRPSLEVTPPTVWILCDGRLAGGGARAELCGNAVASGRDCLNWEPAPKAMCLKS